MDTDKHSLIGFAAVLISIVLVMARDQQGVVDLPADKTMTGPEKQQAIAGTVASDLIAKGYKAEFVKLRDIVVDVVQTAYRALEPIFGNDMIAIASMFHLSPALTAVVGLGAIIAQKAADAAIAPATSPTGISAASGVLDPVLLKRLTEDGGGIIARFAIFRRAGDENDRNIADCRP